MKYSFQKPQGAKGLGWLKDALAVVARDQQRKCITDMIEAGCDPDDIAAVEDAADELQADMRADLLALVAAGVRTDG